MLFFIFIYLVLFSPALNYVWQYYHRHKAQLPPDVNILAQFTLVRSGLPPVYGQVYPLCTVRFAF